MPETVKVDVDAGAVLSLDGVVQPLAALSGMGSVTLSSELTQLSVENFSDFGGTISGSGRLALLNGARLATVTSADVTVPDGQLCVSMEKMDVPIVRTTGKFVLPTSGTVRLTDAKSVGSWAGSTFILAECSSYDGPSSTSEWTFDPNGADAAIKGRFVFTDGKLLLKMSGKGLLLIVR